jgi:hypothetical protein
MVVSGPFSKARADIREKALIYKLADQGFAIANHGPWSRDLANYIESERAAGAWSWK